jgi:hypothetical protein
LVRGFVHVKDSRGMQMLARLVAEPDRELHALDVGGWRRRRRAPRHARATSIASASRGRRRARGRRVEALTAELSRAVGRGRKAGAAAERARTNLTATIRTGTYCGYGA